MRLTRDLLHSLMASTAMTFVISGLMGHKKFAPEDIQNATLAGGVVVGASADMVLQVGVELLEELRVLNLMLQEQEEEGVEQVQQLRQVRQPLEPQLSVWQLRLHRP